ncbi:MAG: DUF3052 family protein [Burkholderiales bacterium]|nr:DUF3052 family protein [Burkholderiales bacterium]MBI3727640.1 DUF3052 family protein [Burkholderiales bacterium]
MNLTSTGYSGTPLAKKLGIRADSHVCARHAPENYLDLLADLPTAVVFDKKTTPATDIVHLFTDKKAVLVKELLACKSNLRSDAAIWVSWPKKASRVPTDITEDTIREVALPMGYVDIKVCAVSDIWSGLKLVVRKELRPDWPTS